MGLAVAVDIGGTRTKVGIVGGDGSVLARAAVATSPRGDPAPLVEEIAAALRPMLDTHGGGGSPVVGVGAAVAGFLDDERGAMIGNANLPALCDFPLRAALEDRLRMKCRLEVDSNASTVAEYRYGGGNGASRLLGVTIGTGLGGGVILDGRLLRYTGACAGDLGHVVVDPSGPRCSCGGRGCLEALVSSSALSARAGNRPVREILSAARSGEADARRALVETGRWLGIGLASLVPVFAPDCIVIGGGVAAAGELLLAAARDSFREQGTPLLVDQTTIVASTLGGWEGMIGAASLVLDPID